MNTINFLYFAHNFYAVQLDKIFNALDNYNHFKSKFETARGNNGTDKFISWFMNLSLDNQLIVTNWVETNYKNL